MNRKFLENLDHSCENSRHTLDDCRKCDQHSLCCEFCETSLLSPLYCFSCDKIQKHLQVQDYYKLFSLPMGYKVDKKQLNEEYERLLTALHPDFHMHSSEKDKVLSLDYTALINDAKNTLEDSFLRGKYLLSVLSPADNALPKDIPQDFILSMFRLQENLDELEINPSHKLIQDVSSNVAELTRGFEQELELKFQAYLDNSSLNGLLDEIKLILAKLKFVINLSKRVEKLGYHHQKFKLPDKQAV